MSTIIDLYDNSIVSYAVGHSNNNKLVFDTLDIAVANNPTAKYKIESIFVINKTYKICTNLYVFSFIAITPLFLVASFK